MQIIPFSLPININHYNQLSLHIFLVYWNYQKSQSTDILYLDEKVKVGTEDNQERGFLTGIITFLKIEFQFELDEVFFSSQPSTQQEAAH